MTRDGDALTELFEEGGVLSARDGDSEARGEEATVRSATAMWEGGRTYLAEPQRILQWRDTALVVAEAGITVMRRGNDGAWRYAISLLAPDHATTTKEEER